MTSDTTFTADLDVQITDVPDDSIVSKTFLSANSVKAIMFGFAAGQELSEHTASKAAILHFISGSADLTLEGETHSVGPNFWTFMPANLPHSVKAKEDTKMLLLLLQPEAD